MAADLGSSSSDEPVTTTEFIDLSQNQDVVMEDAQPKEEEEEATSKSTQANPIEVPCAVPPAPSPSKIPDFEPEELPSTESAGPSRKSTSASPSRAQSGTNTDMEVEVKMEEEDDRGKKKSRKFVVFTQKEDHYLKEGIKKYGKSNWSRILRDPDYKFHSTRNRDSLRVRATTKKMVPKKNTK